MYYPLLLCYIDQSSNLEVSFCLFMIFKNLVKYIPISHWKQYIVCSGKILSCYFPSPFWEYIHFSILVFIILRSKWLLPGATCRGDYSPLGSLLTKWLAFGRLVFPFEFLLHYFQSRSEWIKLHKHPMHHRIITVQSTCMLPQYSTGSSIQCWEGDIHGNVDLTGYSIRRSIHLIPVQFLLPQPLAQGCMVSWGSSNEIN